MDKYVKFIPLILFLFGVLLYSGTLNHGFVYDDEIVLIQNTHVQRGIQGIPDIWTNNYLNGVAGYNDGLYRPTSPTMFAIEKEFFGKNPFPHHLVNVLLYGFPAVFLFGFGRLLFYGEVIPAALLAGLFIALTCRLSSDHRLLENGPRWRC